LYIGCFSDDDGFFSFIDLFRIFLLSFYSVFIFGPFVENSFLAIFSSKDNRTTNVPILRLGSVRGHVVGFVGGFDGGFIGGLGSASLAILDFFPGYLVGFLVHLGQLLHEGTGGTPKDPREAYRLFQLAADQGYDVGQCWVGDCYEMGPDKGGVLSRDVEKSFYWHLKSAERGENTTAMNNVGCSLKIIAEEKYGGMYQVGKCPIPQIMYWYRKGAALGDQDCQINVARWEQDLPSVCANCEVPDHVTRRRLSKCGRCKAAYYCGSACQKKHWTEGHKIDCYSCPKM
jgi:hypothetical protein